MSEQFEQPNAAAALLACDCIDRRTGQPAEQCKRCGGTGQVSTAGRPWLQLVAEATARAQLELANGGIQRSVPVAPVTVRRPVVPRDFESARFANFRCEQKRHEVWLQRVRRWVERAVGGEAPRLALVGATGVGKSHLLYAAIWELFEVQGLLAYSKPWAYSLSDALRYGRPVPGHDDIPPHAVRHELYAERIVLIDEIRFTANTPFDSQELVKFTCHASDNRVATLITTNANPLSLVMGAESADRFEVLVMTGPSMRGKA